MEQENYTEEMIPISTKVKEANQLVKQTNPETRNRSWYEKQVRNLSLTKPTDNSYIQPFHQWFIDKAKKTADKHDKEAKQNHTLVKNIELLFTELSNDEESLIKTTKTLIQRKAELEENIQNNT